jgi:hypothetical protein
MESKGDKKALRYVHTVYRDLSDGLTWETRINPSFTADEVIVRSVAYVDDPANVNVWLLWSDMIVGDGLLASFTNPALSAPQTHFKLKIEKGNVIQFKVLSIAAGSTLVTPGAATGTLAMQLEFVKYA